MDDAQTELSFMQQLAEHPEDRQLRLVFADWLLERGDQRGELLIASTRGPLAARERRRLLRLIRTNATSWLGPLADVVDLTRIEFDGALVSSLVTRAYVAPDIWGKLCGDPRLGLCRSFLLSSSGATDETRRFIEHPIFRNLKRLVGPSSLWELLYADRVPFTLERAGIRSWAAFGPEFQLLRNNALLRAAPALELHTTEYVNPLVVNDIGEQMSLYPPLFSQTRRVFLDARFGVVEGSAAWLSLPERNSRLDAHRFEAWSVQSAETLFELSQARDQKLRKLTISFEIGDGLGAKVAHAASVLVLLSNARLLTEVEVQLPFGAKLMQSERDALRAATRRLGGVNELLVMNRTK